MGSIARGALPSTYQRGGMGHRGWFLLFLPLFLLLSTAGGEPRKKPFEDECPKPRPGKVRGHCSPTCVGKKWVKHACRSVSGPEICGDVCGVELCYIQMVNFCQSTIYGQCSECSEEDDKLAEKLTFNEYYNECVPEDWACPEEDWDCQDPCVYSCDNSSDTSICKVLNRRTGEIGRCSKEGMNSSIPFWFTGTCWDTPEECDPCWMRMDRGRPIYHGTNFYGTYTYEEEEERKKISLMLLYEEEEEKKKGLRDYCVDMYLNPEKFHIGNNKLCCMYPYIVQYIFESGRMRKRDRRAKEECCKIFSGQFTMLQHLHCFDDWYL